MIHSGQIELAINGVGFVLVKTPMDYIIDRVELTSTGAIELTESSLWDDLEMMPSGTGITARVDRELNGALVMEDLGTRMRHTLKIGFRNDSGSLQKLDVQIQTITKPQAIHKYGVVHN